MCDRALQRILKVTQWGLLLMVFAFLQVHTQPLAVIETFEAGPEKVKKKVSGVKTNYTWSKPDSCNCPTEEGPCIQTFLDKRIPQPKNRYPSRIEDYYIQNNMGSEYQGAGAVPWGIDVASVRLLNIPFCRQEKQSASKK